MRPIVLGIGALAVLAVGLLYYVFVALRPAHAAALVPADFSIGLFYRSVDDLRALYEGPHMRRDLDVGEMRVGRRVNVPGLDGVSYRNPVGSYFTAKGDEILLVPVTDPDAFEDAFEVEREDLRLRDPEQVARNYLSLSSARVKAKRGPDNPLVLRACEFPLAVVGRPADAKTFQRLLLYGLLYEPHQRPKGVPLLFDAVRALPEPAAAFAARACDDFLLGLERTPDGAVRGVFEATLDGAAARGAALAAELDLGALARSFPGDTVLLAGGVLDAAGWTGLGVTLPLGDAALACGIVETKMRARRFTILLAAQPRRPADLEELTARGHTLLLEDPAATLAWKEAADGATTVRTAPLPEPPARWSEVLRSAAKVPPPVYVATAVEDGIWYAALGTQAGQAIRHALGCRRGATELSIVGPRGPALFDRGFAAERPLAVALVSAQGLAAFRQTMPLFEVASVGQPLVVTATIHAEDGRATGTILLGK